ncbi:uncharacterized protein LOC126618331 [Malus sylvestris]|uniref:uncharacterized protein LOC126618331 n=1 Tax=Malus sylvestris TaxID=3752 RepID=UPI0021ACFC44|nr:uncharacterized protein LOC126618331 [Malus sylvestris]
MSDLHRFCFPFEHRLFLDRWEVNFLQPSKSCSNFGLSVRNLASCLRSSSQVHCTVQLFCPLQPTTTFSNKFTKNNQGGLQADSVKLHHYWYSSCPPYKKHRMGSVASAY